MKKLFMLAVSVMTIMAMAIPVGAITKGGAPDAGEHPYVGLMVAYSDNFIDHDGDETTPDRREPLWRCSGSLLSSTVYVTAGHCVGPESSAEDADTPAYVGLWFAEDVEALVGDQGYPWYEFAPATGLPHPHPDYVPNAFFLFDVGVVTLDQPVYMPFYGELPDEGVVDTFENGRKKATIEAVGYGLQNANKNHTVAIRQRMKADLFIVNRNGVAGLKQIFGFVPGSGSFLMSGDAAHGGTCFGDSGGPILQGDSNTLVGVNSFGLNGNCAGVGGAYRIDQADDLEFIGGFLD